MSSELAAILARPLTSFRDVHWRAQDSTKEDLLFYWIPAGAEAEKTFLERVSAANYAHLCINRAVTPLPAATTVLPSADWTRLQAEALDAIYPLPAALKLIAVTGTNGKTTTTDLVLQLGGQAGKKGMSIGTLGVRTPEGPLLDFGLTSPPFIDLRKYLHRYGRDLDFCVMEASSHALHQDRLHGLCFEAAGWTSFTQDHLDYHGDMGSYFEAKCLLLQKLRPGAKLFVPARQAELLRLLRERSPAVFEAPTLAGALPLFFSPPFNRDNLSLALSLVREVFGAFTPDFSRLTSPDGRFYIRQHGSSFLVVDFAHTPDALENICRGLRESFPHHRLKVLFGCGGDRDRRKRPLMGKAAQDWADWIYLTSDNPRSEPPEQIISDILTGIAGDRVSVEPDRQVAVRRAFAELGENEVLLLAGKGHEDYILQNGVKRPYSDIAEVDRFVSEKTHD
jgi:UDP-N-acetylmuramoyl-L-alanyl-D-glutamate--2,6-diaminopimelate ligase